MHNAAPHGVTIIFFFFLPTNTKWSQTGSIAFYVEEDDSKAARRKKDCRKGFPEHWICLSQRSPFFSSLRCFAAHARNKGPPPALPDAKRGKKHAHAAIAR